MPLREVRLEGLGGLTHLWRLSAFLPEVALLLGLSSADLQVGRFPALPRFPRTLLLSVLPRAERPQDCAWSRFSATFPAHRA
jgi:hypothetical protein